MVGVVDCQEDAAAGRTCFEGLARGSEHRKLVGRNAHRGYIERVAVAEARRISLHQLDHRADGVGHIHHIESCIGP